jgi:hypothetical protein
MNIANFSLLIAHLLLNLPMNQQFPINLQFAISN